jgi:mannose-6-phosphate isomerase-like protein (cupin superfamily)
VLVPARDIERLAAEARASPDGYVEFLRVAPMSGGVYVLGPGALDRQGPHAEDEVYFVVRGRGRFRQGDGDRAVAAGDLLFVAAQEPHRFHSVEQELVLLVIFAPAESPPSARRAPGR